MLGKAAISIKCVSLVFAGGDTTVPRGLYANIIIIIVFFICKDCYREMKFFKDLILSAYRPSENLTTYIMQII